MRRRHFQSIGFLIAAGAWLAAAPGVNGQSAPIPHSSTSTNTSAVNGAMALQNLDEKFGTPFGSLKQPLHDDLFSDPLVVNVPQPFVNNSKARDLLDKSENWAFLTPADYNDQGTIEEAIGAPSTDQSGTDGKKTALDRFNEQGFRTGVMGTNQMAAAAPNSDQGDDSDGTTSPGKLDKFGKAIDSDDPNDVDGGKEAIRTSKLDATSPIFADPNSTWGFSDVFGRKESKDKEEKESEQFRDSDSEKDIFARLQAGPSFTAVPDANTSVANGGLDSLNNLMDPSQQTAPAAVPDLPVADTSTDATPGMQPAAGGSAPEDSGLQESAIAPVAPGAEPSTPSESSRIDLSRYANPQPIFSPPKRQY